MHTFKSRDLYDGTLRLLTENSLAKRLYVSSYYQLDYSSGQIDGGVTYYRFSGKVVGWCKGTDLRYIHSDLLGSTKVEEEVLDPDVGRRRYSPFGGDVAVQDSPDLVRDERFTGQVRLQAGSPTNPRLEIYTYGARAYLPGVGIVSSRTR